MKKIKKLNVAVIFFGQPRFVNLPLTPISLKWALRKSKVSYFGHVWFDESELNFDSAPWSGLIDQKLQRNTKSLIDKWYPTGSFIYEKPQHFEIEPKVEKKLREVAGLDSDLNRKIDNLSNTFSQIVSINKAFNHFLRETNSQNFDFLVLTRLDVFVWNFPNLSNLNNDNLYVSNLHNRFPDLLLFGSKEKVFSTDAIDLVSSKDLNIEVLTGEGLKQKAFLQVNKPESVVPINFEVWPIRKDSLINSILNIIVTYLKFKFLKILQRIKNRIDF